MIRKLQFGNVGEALLLMRTLAIVCAALIALGSVAGHASAAATQPFSAFKCDVDIDIEDGELEFMAAFTLASGSNGIDPAKEIVQLQLKGGSGAYAVMIPAGSFKAASGGAFVFQGTIDRVRLKASIRPSRDGGFEFELENERANMKGFANPVSVSLTIGDDGASASVRAKIE